MNKSSKKLHADRSDIVFYRTEGGQDRIQVRLEDETVWLSQRQMVDLFQTTSQKITLHIKDIYEDGEMEEEATCKDFLQVRREGDREVRRHIKHYNLNMILAVGYLVRSKRGVQFRKWVTERRRKEASGDFCAAFYRSPAIERIARTLRSTGGCE